jgi:uncharacterized protein involved in cysteine biosynthesis
MTAEAELNKSAAIETLAFHIPRVNLFIVPFLCEASGLRLATAYFNQD